MIHWRFRRRRGEKHKNVWTIWLSVRHYIFWGRKWKSFGPETVKEARSSLVSEKQPLPTIWILPRKLTAGTWTKRPLGTGKKNITYRWWFFQYVVIFNFDLRILFRMGRKRKTPTTNNQPIFGGSKAVRFFGAAARMRMALAKAWPLNPWRRVSWEFVQIGNPRGFALMMIKERFFLA